MSYLEVNIDGLVGPTHSYSGLSSGNVACVENEAETSSPKEAALQGLNKMKLMADLGLEQWVLPPLVRPHLQALKNWGFDGENEALLENAYERAPHLYAAVVSASSMWAANAGTVAPDLDAKDGRFHFTAANLVSKLHRSLEPQETWELFKRIFKDQSRFEIHKPLTASVLLGDEGAANHTRLCPSHGVKGIQLFVYGFSAYQDAPKSQKYVARQSREASEAIARRHLLDPEYVIFAQQNPEAIDAGVFHNDVISVGNENVFIYHEKSFLDTERTLEELKSAYQKNYGEQLVEIRVDESVLPLADAVHTYLFNSQVVTLLSGGMALIAPKECEDHKGAYKVIEEWVSDRGNPIESVHYVDLKGSMRNGGGPACLRLRMVLSESDRGLVEDYFKLTDERYAQLLDVVETHYPDQLTRGDLAQEKMFEQVEGAFRAIEYAFSPQ